MLHFSSIVQRFSHDNRHFGTTMRTVKMSASVVREQKADGLENLNKLIWPLIVEQFQLI